MTDQVLVGHIGITVSNIETSFAFYKKYFGFHYVRGGDFNPQFFEGKNNLYQVPEGTTGRYAFIDSPDGIPFELFEFHPSAPAEAASWIRPGYHHICMKVPDFQGTVKALMDDGYMPFFPEVVRGHPMHDMHWIFFKDPDGNYVELHD